MEEKNTYTPTQVARMLRLTPHRIRQMLHRGELEGVQDSATSRWMIPQIAVQNILDKRRIGEGSGPVTAGEYDVSERILRLEEVLKDIYQKMGRMEGRLEFRERAENTLREEGERLLKHLEYERERAQRERQRTVQLEQQLLEAHQNELRLEAELEGERSKGSRRKLFGG
jgi:hypothetical protein